MVHILEEIKQYIKLKDVIFGLHCTKTLILTSSYVFSVLNIIHADNRPPGTLRLIQPPEDVWQLVSLDFHGPTTPTSQRGNKYIICLTNALSKFVVTKAIGDNAALTAVRFLKEDIITKFGTPRCLLTDNGTHFTSALMDALIKQVGAIQLYALPYHPQTNGQVERYN